MGRTVALPSPGASPRSRRHAPRRPTADPGVVPGQSPRSAISATPRAVARVGSRGDAPTDPGLADQRAVRSLIGPIPVAGSHGRSDTSPGADRLERPRLQPPCGASAPHGQITRRSGLAGHSRRTGAAAGDRPVLGPRGRIHRLRPAGRCGGHQRPTLDRPPVRGGRGRSQGSPGHGRPSGRGGRLTRSTGSGHVDPRHDGVRCPDLHRSCAALRHLPRVPGLPVPIEPAPRPRPSPIGCDRGYTPGAWRAPSGAGHSARASVRWEEGESDRERRGERRRLPGNHQEVRAGRASPSVCRRPRPGSALD